jgi:hypothetical protein
MEFSARIFHRGQLVGRRIERGIGAGQRRDDLFVMMVFLVYSFYSVVLIWVVEL